GLFIRLDYAIRTVRAKRVVLDTIEALFGGLSNQAVLRSEIRRLFGWLKERGLTTVITGERGDQQLTRQGLEEYVSDCVILLDHRVHGQISTRRLRIVKYRGSTHGTNEFPFLIDETGFSVLPVTSSGMDYAVSTKRMPTGIRGLDDMLDGAGFYRGSTVLLSGTAGTGKTSVAAHVVDAACRRGERCIYFSFEESPGQILRDMRSIGLNLAGHVRRGLLLFHSTRPTVHGIETHLVQMHKLVDRFAPQVVVLDPVSNLQAAGTLNESTNLLIRLVDFLRRRHVLALLLSLTTAGRDQEATEEGISSMVDTWLLLRDIEFGGERNRAMYVLKSRGMAHSNQIREFLITSKGVRLVSPYLGSSRVLTGSARLTQEARDRADANRASAELARKRLALAHRRKSVEAQIAALQAQLHSEDEEFHRARSEHESVELELASDRAAMAASRRLGSALKP
ncbi:MAG TPA: circadian clock protein KaiC, partial [Opitutus sp.]|nr:circadian clock protein KaiC [Opitutus sp.]